MKFSNEEVFNRFVKTNGTILIKSQFNNDEEIIYFRNITGNGLFLHGDQIEENIKNGTIKCYRNCAIGTSWDNVEILDWFETNPIAILEDFLNE